MTQVLHYGDLVALNRKDDLAQLQAEVSSIPNTLQQTYGADSHDFDMPPGCDNADSRPCVVDDSNDLDWEAEDKAKLLKERLRVRAGYCICCEDYQTDCLV